LRNCISLFADGIGAVASGLSSAQCYFGPGYGHFHGFVVSAKLINPRAPVTDDQIDHVEALLGVTLPIAYRKFLLATNGGRPDPDGIDISWSADQTRCDHWRTSLVSRFLAIHDGEKANFVEYNLETFKGRIPPDTIAIAYDAGGNLILLGVGEENNGKVFFWVKDHEVEEGETPGYDNVGILADSLTEFLDKKLR
jgi:SMI1 / KNR4 family (SUKH-1)